MNIRSLFPFLALLLIVMPSAAKAEEPLQTKEFTPSICEMAVGGFRAPCDLVSIGLVQETFNIKVCTTKDKYICVILAGDAEELNYYPLGEIKLFSIALQKGGTIVQNLSDQLLLKPYKEGLKADGLAENISVNVYFSLPISERGFGMD